MTEKDTGTEKKILDAARKIFLQKGKAGARMQEIADEAGINKALLHYYFRTKDRLFEAIYQEVLFKVLVPGIIELMKSDLPLFTKIEKFADKYISVMSENPMIPGFILYDMHTNPERVASQMLSTGIKPEIFAAQVREEIRKGTIREIDPQQLVVHMLALCIFPFVARPVLQAVVFRNDSAAFNTFIEERKKAIPELIINAIKKP